MTRERRNRERMEGIRRGMNMEWRWRGNLKSTEGVIGILPKIILDSSLS
jgi:hypothetical protein